MSSTRAMLSRTARPLARPLVVVVTALAALTASALAYADGIDLSHWQGTVSWSKVRSDDVTFAFMKATEGTYYTDPTLKKNWDGAKQVGIYRAAYHFARPTMASGSAAAQARYFVSKAGTFQNKGDLPPVLDLEASGGLSSAHLRSWVSTWLTTTQKLTGRVPILYFSPSFWVDHMGNSTAFAKYPLWIAHYTSGHPTVPGGWKTWTFWQHTSSGHVSGISGTVDMNRFNGTSKQLAALALSSGGSSNPAPGGPSLPAGMPTQLSMTASTTTPVRGSLVSFSGVLSKVTTGYKLRGRPVTLWRRPVGWKTWRLAHSTTTDGAGHFTFSAKLLRTGDWQARFAATKSYAAGISPTVRLTVAKTPVAVDLHQEHPVVRKGAPVMIYGHVTSAGHGLAQQTVRYYKRMPAGGSWVYVGTCTSLAPTGWHSLVIRPQVDRIYKAVYSGTSSYASTRSQYLRVDVP